MKTYIISGIIALSISLGVIWLAPEILPGTRTLKIEHIDGASVLGAMYTVNKDDEVVPLDFTGVAEDVMDAVVHIRSTQTGRGQQYQEIPEPFRDFFERFFGPEYRFDTPQQPHSPDVRIGAGSGVIINSDGYIVSNYHVVTNADDIEVTLYDNRTYKASVVGTDPSTDLALVRIEEEDLPILPMGDSDSVLVGEWVLAVGNPFNLNSTVTAGIISAKSRNINILQDQYAVESFIQTDAAINPGNSGGALVNLQGGLIGINTAIASPTGAYAGYGFAVPSNIVSKVVEDLIKYGTVQRGYLGVTIRGINSNLIREEDLEVSSGVYIDSVVENSAAMEAGIKPGDVVMEIDGSPVSTPPELQEIIARHRPGDELAIKINRDGDEETFNVELRNREGEARLISKDKSEVLNLLGADFEEVDRSTARRLNIDGGVRVVRLYAGKLANQTDIREGFIITKVDGKQVKQVEDLTNILEDKEGGVLLEGVYENLPGVHYYAFGL